MVTQLYCNIYTISKHEVVTSLFTGRLHKEPMIIPVYVPIRLSVAEGLLSGTRADFVKMTKHLHSMGSSSANGKVNGNMGNAFQV